MVVRLNIAYYDAINYYFEIGKRNGFRKKRDF